MVLKQYEIVTICPDYANTVSYFNTAVATGLMEQLPNEA